MESCLEDVHDVNLIADTGLVLGLPVVQLCTLAMILEFGI